MEGYGFEKVELKFATRLVNSGPVIMVSSGDDAGRAVMTAAWNMPVQKEPPIIAVGMGKSHHTWETVRRAGDFVINIPGWDMLEQVKYCGSVSGYKEDKYASGRFAWSDGEKVGSPVISGVLGFLECRLDRAFELDKLSILLGRVVRCAARRDCFDGTWKPTMEGIAFVHHLGGSSFYRSSPE